MINGADALTPENARTLAITNLTGKIRLHFWQLVNEDPRQLEVLVEAARLAAGQVEAEARRRNLPGAGCPLTVAGAGVVGASKGTDRAIEGESGDRIPGAHHLNQEA